ENLLDGYFKQQKEEILANSLTEFDAEEAYRDIRNDGYEEGLAEGRETGRVEGASQKAIEDAENLLRMGVNTIEQISQAIGLPLEKVQEIAEQLRMQNA
ncbi:MAG: Rpn family recombination-promoting nuclease/putative transposase, partial [Treponema sp.]|nr:Rpn family recombination-promoting nuclease/putative transposase [Treponema sp.]